MLAEGSHFGRAQAISTLHRKAIAFLIIINELYSIIQVELKKRERI